MIVHDNAQHLHRHALHALEDFDSVRRLLEESPDWTHEIEKRIHSLSHHLRHVVYRSGLEVRDRRHVRRSARS
jgi:hypothetical protein